MFTQGRRPAQQSLGGLGIGLALARRLVELHDGDREVRKAGVDQGSDFVRLPLAAQGQPQSAPTNQIVQVRALTEHCILVVGDIKDSADSLAKLLQLKATPN